MLQFTHDNSRTQYLVSNHLNLRLFCAFGNLVWTQNFLPSVVKG